MKHGEPFEVDLSWRSADAGGRRTGPPPGPRYFATAAFATNHENAEALAAQYSVELEFGGRGNRGSVRFLVPEVVHHDVQAGTRLWILEGVRIVADAVVIDH
ncbi:MAG: hypothetical protein QM598_05410 [Protaetiibacter sp.]